MHSGQNGHRARTQVRGPRIGGIHQSLHSLIESQVKLSQRFHAVAGTSQVDAAPYKHIQKRFGPGCRIRGQGYQRLFGFILKRKQCVSRVKWGQLSQRQSGGQADHQRHQYG